MSDAADDLGCILLLFDSCCLRGLLRCLAAGGLTLIGRSAVSFAVVATGYRGARVP